MLQPHTTVSNMDRTKHIETSPHVSVLLNEVIAQLQPFADGYYIDATFGAGGYSRAILSAYKGAKVIAFDKDASVKVFAQELSKEFPNRVEFIHASYIKIGEVLKNKGISANAIVYDLGVSSMQLDNKERGFSFEGTELLDMRMDLSQSFSAFNVVNEYDEHNLANIIFHYGDERKSRIIAKKIVDFRKNKGPIETTNQLSKIITSVVKRVGKIHPATKTFQAIRIEVNDELNQLKTSIKNSLPHIKIGGKMLAVTFHSGEDKIVKRIFGECTSSGSDKQGYFERNLPIIPNIIEAESAQFEKLNKKVIKPTDAEVALNARSRSAKLRGIARVRNAC